MSKRADECRQAWKTLWEESDGQAGHDLTDEEIKEWARAEIEATEQIGADPGYDKDMKEWAMERTVPEMTAHIRSRYHRIVGNRIMWAEEAGMVEGAVCDQADAMVEEIAEDMGIIEDEDESSKWAVLRDAVTEIFEDAVEEHNQGMEEEDVQIGNPIPYTMTDTLWKAILESLQNNKELAEEDEWNEGEAEDIQAVIDAIEEQDGYTKNLYGAMAHDIRVYLECSIDALEEDGGDAEIFKQAMNKMKEER